MRVLAWLPLTTTLLLSWTAPAVHALPNKILIAQMSAQDYFNQGKALSRRYDYQGAIKAYTQVIHLQPNNAGAYSNRASVRDSLEDYMGAIED